MFRHRKPSAPPILPLSLREASFLMHSGKVLLIVGLLFLVFISEPSKVYVTSHFFLFWLRDVFSGNQSNSEDTPDSFRGDEVNPNKDGQTQVKTHHKIIH